jgi:hypothetical protein
VGPGRTLPAGPTPAHAVRIQGVVQRGQLGVEAPPAEPERRRVLRGRLTFWPRADRQGYDFVGPTPFDKLFTGIAVEQPAWIPNVPIGAEGIRIEDTRDAHYERLLEAAERAINTGSRTKAKGWRPWIPYSVPVWPRGAAMGRGSWVAAGVLAASLKAVAAAEAGAEWPRVALADPEPARWIKAALDGAARRLAEPRCQGLLMFYADEARRPLADRLAALETTPQAYLGLLLWRDGSQHPRCTGRASWTTRSSRVVFVCEQNVLRLWATDRDTAEATVIHEALHTLGLGEAPEPGQATPREITDEVLARCS